jgi:hypothetical protein
MVLVHTSHWIPIYRIFDRSLPVMLIVLRDVVSTGLLKYLESRLSFSWELN